MVRIPRKLKKDIIKVSGRDAYISIMKQMREYMKSWGYVPVIKIRKA